MDENTLILVCDESMEGIFTAVYDGWKEGAKGRKIEICPGTPENQRLFCEYRYISTNLEKASKVSGTIGRKLGNRTYEAICYAAVSNHPDRGSAIFGVLSQALAKGHCNGAIMDALADPDVNLVAKLQVKVWHEFHRFFGFVRFQELNGRILFSKIAPENDILAMLAPHFANRYPRENWMIYDERRRKVLVHPRDGECCIHVQVDLQEIYERQLAKPEEFEQLWKAFCKSITIAERKNPKLQQQFAPLKFRSNMLEFEHS